MTVDYKPLANDPAANVIAQAVFETLLNVGGALEHGFQDGVARSEYMNKVLRQSSVMTAAIANMISETLGVNLLDDGDVDALKELLKQALITSAWSTGDAKITMKTVADQGWIMHTDGSIGSATSGATYANADAEDLYLFMWTQYADAQAPVFGGRGLNAAADWGANKRITLPKVLGRALGVAGAGAGLTARTAGVTLGNESITLTQNEMPALTAHYNSGSAPYGVLTPFDTSPQNVLARGNEQPFSLMQPSTFMFNVMLKL